MEIILKQDIIGLGYKNDIVNVKSGYGRNFLIPTGKAVIASPSAKKQLAEDLKQQAHKLEAIKAEAVKKGEALEGIVLTIAAKVISESGSIGISKKFCILFIIWDQHDSNCFYHLLHHHHLSVLLQVFLLYWHICLVIYN